MNRRFFNQVIFSQKVASQKVASQKVAGQKVAGQKVASRKVFDQEFLKQKIFNWFDFAGGPPGISKQKFFRQRLLTSAALGALCLTTLVLTISVGSAQLKNAIAFEIPGWSNSPPAPAAAPHLDQPISRLCAVQPERIRTKQHPKLPLKPLVEPGEPMTLERFRGPLPGDRPGNGVPFKPREEIALIDPTNYGDRYLKDLDGKPTNHEPIVVLHETVGAASSVVNYFRTPHLDDDDQVSYHTLVKLDGTLLYLVPPEKRAFGAGNSVFKGAQGLETVKTNLAFPPSVNNFAYHISLETPDDGENDALNHSGYTASQYKSLAWLVARTGVANDRISTHKIVDRSSSRIDPRSFNMKAFLQLLDNLPHSQAVAINCVPPANAPTATSANAPTHPATPNRQLKS